MVKDYDFEGSLWRVIPSSAVSAYDLRYTNDQASGRWNHEDGTGCFYASLSEQGALAEFNRRRENEYLPIERHDMVEVEMKVSRVMNLTDPGERSKHAIRKEQMVGFGSDDYEACRNMAGIAQSRGYHALLSPCAPTPEESNLNIFTNSTAPEWIAVDDVPHRAPVTEHFP